MPKLTNAVQPSSTTRRKFLQGLVMGSVAGAIAPHVNAQQHRLTQAVRGNPREITGPEVELVISETTVNITGEQRIATTVNGSLPAPTLRFREGDDVTIRVTNHLNVPTSIHWHGIILPYQMDGVPGISFDGIAPGETFVYQFKLQQSGTYWYHSHSGFQKVTGLYGALIIEPKEKEIYAVERDHIIQLADWSDEDPMRVFSKLKVQSDMYNFNQPTIGEFFKDVANNGISVALSNRRMWQQMRMNPTDLADLSASTLTFLLNGHTSDENWNALGKPGERVRLRFINTSSNTLFDVRIPSLVMQVVQADGQNVKPVDIEEFRFGPGETYDVIVEPTAQAHTLFAQSIDRTGFASASLVAKQGSRASIPAMDEAQPLSMTDMMGAMTMERGTDHSNHSSSLSTPSTQVRHASTEYGASVDARIDTPRLNLDDPGIGLRNNGRRVLTLADLRALETLDNSVPPTREIELHLTGNMERYSWSLDGLEYRDSTPIHMRKGERVRIILQNDTMMIHPMHLHGMWSDLENEHGELLSRRHTILVQPAQRISFLTTPEDAGLWAWHCHLMFHMDAGMFRKVIVS